MVLQDGLRQLKDVERDGGTENPFWGAVWVVKEKMEVKKMKAKVPWMKLHDRLG